MKCIGTLLCLAAACSSATGARIVSGAAARAATGTPVEKVVELLKDLKSKIEMDGKVESQTYDKYACWCEKTTARKASAIEDAQDQLRSLGQQMLKLKGQVATLLAEIAQLDAEIKDNQEAQAEATSIRQKQNAEFASETAEMKEVLAALEKAIIVLREGTKMGGTFLQQGTAASSAVKAVIEALPASANLKPKQASMLTEFTNMKEGSNYAPQSWTVQGILRDMYDTFAADLETATETEATRNRDFELFIAEKLEQLALLQETRAKKEAAKAEAAQLLADTTQTYDDTSAQMKADIAFFDETKAACESKHSDWGVRKELRQQELLGIEKALEILTSDAARELFAKSIKAGKETHMDNKYDTGVSIDFLQVNSEDSAPPARAYAALKAAAKGTHSLRLAALAARVREAKVGHFDAVIKAIDDMILTLKEEDAADIAKRDQCKSEYQKINSTVADLVWKIKVNKAKIDKLLATIEQLNEEKVKTQEEIVTVKKQIADMKAQRKEENTAFLEAKANDQASIKLLVQARDFLSKYFVDNDIELGPIQGDIKALALSQQGPDFDVSADQAPEAVFSNKGKRKHESKGIIQLLTMIMEDLNDEIKNDMKAEEQAQLEFEKQLAAANTLLDNLIAKEVHLGEMIAERTKEKDDEDADMKANIADLTDEKQYLASIKSDCDWIIGAWAKRAEHRTAEMQGLVGAKEYLAGYQESTALLERGHGAFDDNALAGLSFSSLGQ